VYLYFEGVYNRSEVFVNGRSLGVRPNGYISFMYDATPYVEFGKENTLTVRVDHSRSADLRWYTGSGIYCDVWLVYANTQKKKTGEKLGFTPARFSTLKYSCQRKNPPHVHEADFFFGSLRWQGKKILPKSRSATAAGLPKQAPCRPPCRCTAQSF
jgi:hypothetical protein